MERRIIGVCGRKGGSGKTTLAVNIAAEFASRGMRTVLVDCDTQGSALHWSSPGKLPMPVEQHALDAQRTAADSRAEISRWVASLGKVAADVLVLDSPPHLDATLGGIIGLSHVAVVPCGPSGLDLVATAETVGLVREINRAKGKGAARMTLVPNRIDGRTASGRQLAGALAEIGEDVSPPIYARTALADAFNLGMWVGEYAPASAAHVEIQQLASHILRLAGQKPGK